MPKFTETSALEALAGRTQFAQNEMRSVADAARALDELAGLDAAGPQHSQRVSRAAAKFGDHVKRTREALAEKQRVGTETLTAQRRERLRLDTDKSFLPIVTAFQNATQQQRVQWLGQAVESGDGRTLAALMETPAFASGVDTEMLSKHLDAAEAKHAPDLFEKRQQFEQESESTQTALQTAEALAAKAVDLPSAEAANRADEAERALSEL